MSQVIGLNTLVADHVSKLRFNVDHHLGHLNKKDLLKYIVLSETLQGEAASLWKLCGRVDEKVKVGLLTQILKINKRLQILEKTVKFYESNSAGIDPRVCWMQNKLEKICKVDCKDNKAAQEKSLKKINSLKFVQCEMHYDPASNKETALAVKTLGKSLIDAEKAIKILREPIKKPEIIKSSEKTAVRKTSTLIQLQNLVEALSYRNEQGYNLAVKMVDGLSKIPFQEDNGVETKGKTFGDRIFFHIYHIHKKESPHRINPYDMQYGTNAFYSKDGSTADERLRAAQRTQLEQLFSLLDLTIQKNAVQGSLDVIKNLESLKLNASDMPSGVTNLAHGLFGMMYQDYLRAYEHKDANAGYNPSWVHPHDSMFNSDFGRNAFLGDAKDRVPSAFKVQVVQSFIKSVKENWGV